MALPAAARARNPVRNHLWVEFRQDGRIVGGAVSRSGRVRWGPAIGLEFTYPIPELTGWEELFASRRGEARLRLYPGMTGEVCIGDSWLRLEDLEDWGLARGRRGRRWLRLSPLMGGEIRYRGIEITFHFAGPPEARDPERPRWGRVPLRFRRGFLSREEWPFAVLTWSLYGALLYLSMTLSALELPEAPSPERVAKRFAKLIYEVPQAPTRARAELLKKAEGEAAAVEDELPPEPEPELEVEPESEAAPQEPPVAAEETPSATEPVTETEPAAVPEPGPDPAKRKQEIREQVAKKGLLGLLGGRGAAATAKQTRGSILEGQGAVADLDRVLENVEGLRSARPGSTGDGLGDGDGLSGAIDAAAGQVAAAGRRVAQVRQREEQVVEAKEEVTLDELTLKEVVAAIHKAVGTYLGGIRYLYNRELRRDPALEGKLTVSITVSPEGEVLACEVVDSTLDAPSLEQAILKRVKKWKLPPVAPKPITVTYPFVFFPSM